MSPTPSEAASDTSNAINQIVLRLRDYLPKYGWEVTEFKESAAVVACHAGQGANGVVDVAHCHGLYPTALPNPEYWHWAANKAVVSNLTGAKKITVPSEWVADILRRDMHVDPDVIGWAINPEEWSVGQPLGYVLWNKTRVDQVCDPTPAMSLAEMVPEVPFVTTFGSPMSNVRVIGRQTKEAMKGYILGASVYLATTKETFGIGTLEAMRAGVPILGYDWGSTRDVVKHGETGYLVDPGDIQGLADGLRYCLENRGILGANAREVAGGYNWETVAKKIAAVYDDVIRERQSPIKISVVIPCHNYGRFVGEAIDSVINQETEYPYEIIVVNDKSTDNSAEVIKDRISSTEIPIGVVQSLGSAVGVANARNAGIARARGEYIVCLDADDRLGAYTFLQTLAEDLDADRSLGIVYTGLRVMDEDGNLSPNVNPWPGEYDFDQQLAGKNQVPTCCMFRREAWRRAGGYRTLYEPAEDANLWLMMGSIGYKAKMSISEGWFHYRLHSNSLSSDVRKGNRPEPDWKMSCPWAYDNKRPLASDGKPRPHSHSWPVRNYDRPLVSVIIPVGPKHEYIVRQALDSVESQTERMWEAIVINDSGAEIDLSGHPWARMWKTSEKGGTGSSHSRNLGIEKASAPLIAFLDADDMFLPQFLEKTLRGHSRSGGYVYTDWVSLSKTGMYEEHQTPDFVPGDVFRKTSTHSINVLMPKEWAQRIGGFDESMSTWEDVDFFMKMAAANMCGFRVPEALTMYRYSTGYLREMSMDKVKELKEFLADRYREYITGEKMCSCDAVQPQQTVVVPSDSAMSSDQFGPAVRVEYTGERVPLSPVTLRGTATNTMYGRRGKGDIFLVWKMDFEAMRDSFVEIPHIQQEMRKTSAPPPPVLLQGSMI